MLNQVVSKTLTRPGGRATPGRRRKYIGSKNIALRDHLLPEVPSGLDGRGRLLLSLATGGQGTGRQ